jgi:hypothetical protein
VLAILCGCGPPPVAVGLRVDSPTGPLGSSGSPNLVDSLQPTLRWATLDVAGLRIDPVRAQKVTYEVKVWSVEARRGPPTLVYSRAGLTTPQHRVETPLEPGSPYAWTVRAHFELDGAPRVTRWSGHVIKHPVEQIGEHLEPTPQLGYHVFRTLSP